MSVLAHKNIYIEAKTGLSKYFTKIDTIQCRNTRHANEMNLVIPRINSVNGRKAIEYRGPVTWNRMEATYKLINELSTFKTELLKRITPELANHST